MGNIKKNHIFTCNGDRVQMIIRQSNLDEHCEYVIYLRKKGPWDISRQDIIRILDEVLAVPLPHTGLNPYKMAEMFAKYRPVILYAEPSKEVYSRVKMEKTERLEFWAKLKATKYKSDTEKIEKMAFDGREGEA